LVTEPVSGKIVRSAKELKPGDQVATRLAQGGFVSRVEKIQEEF
jgi:preprotein translocase subunit YajC